MLLCECSYVIKIYLFSIIHVNYYIINDPFSKNLRNHLGNVSSFAI